jgi:hypothetical protein
LAFRAEALGGEDGVEFLVSLLVFGGDGLDWLAVAGIGESDGAVFDGEADFAAVELFGANAVGVESEGGDGHCLEVFRLTL